MKRTPKLRRNKILRREFRLREPENYQAAYIWARVISVILFGLGLPVLLIFTGLMTVIFQAYDHPALVVLAVASMTYIALLRRMLNHAKENHLRAFATRMLDQSEEMFCAECGYVLKLIESRSCPECGTPSPNSVDDYRR